MSGSEVDPEILAGLEARATFARTVADRWDANAVALLDRLVRDKLATLDDLTREFAVVTSSEVGRRVHRSRRLLSGVLRDLELVEPARTRLLAERTGGRVCVSCGSVIRPHAGSGLWSAQQDTFAPGDACSSHDRRHVPEDAAL